MKPLIIFAKAPVAGQAKTRLIPAIGAEKAALVHAWLLKHSIQQAIQSVCDPIYLYTAGGHDHPYILELLNDYPLLHRKQKDGDLGERMYLALSDFQTGALLIGSDCPELDAEVLNQAAQSLEKNEAVFVPAEDGGYALVGMNKVNRHVFDDISWSSERVMQQTRDRLSTQNLKYEELRTLWDVDRPEDLNRLKQCLPAILEVTR